MRPPFVPCATCSLHVGAEGTVPFAKGARQLEAKAISQHARVLPNTSFPWNAETGRSLS